MAGEMVYIATDPHCGHVVGMSIDNAERSEDVADEVWRWIRDGCIVTRVPVEEARLADLCQCAHEVPDAEANDPAALDYDQMMTTAACMGLLADYALSQGRAYQKKARGLRAAAHVPTAAEFFAECSVAWQTASLLCEERAAALKHFAIDSLTRKMTEARSGEPAPAVGDQEAEATE